MKRLIILLLLSLAVISSGCIETPEFKPQITVKLEGEGLSTWDNSITINNGQISPNYINVEITRTDKENIPTNIKMRFNLRDSQNSWAVNDNGNKINSLETDVLYPTKKDTLSFKVKGISNISDIIPTHILLEFYWNNTELENKVDLTVKIKP